MAILVAGGLLVAALVIWALTRTVEPESVMTDSSSVPTASVPATTPSSTQPAPPPVTGTSLSTPSAVATGQPVPPPPVQGDRSAVQRIAVEDLRARLNRSEVTVIDVRDARAFATGHIPGSLNVPFASVESMLDTIPKDKPIVTYCT